MFFFCDHNGVRWVHKKKWLREFGLNYQHLVKWTVNSIGRPTGFEGAFEQPTTGWAPKPLKTS